MACLTKVRKAAEGMGWEGTQTGTSGTRIEHDSDSRLFMEADKAKSQGQGCVTVKGRY